MTLPTGRIAGLQEGKGKGVAAITLSAILQFCNPAMV
jgi:hypothetical protein